jgi:hypothetical protein
VSFDVVKVGGGFESVILPIQPAHPTKGGREEITNEYKRGEQRGIQWVRLASGC